MESFDSYGIKVRKESKQISDRYLKLSKLAEQWITEDKIKETLRKSAE